jgi:hypothetical protein
LRLKPLEILSSRGLMFLMVWQGNFAEFMVRKSSSFLALLPMLLLIPLLAFTHHFLGCRLNFLAIHAVLL